MLKIIPTYTEIPAFFRRLIWLFCLFFSIGLGGQTTTLTETVYEDLLPILAENMEQGDLIALRDLGKIYDKNTENESIIKLLKRHTLFTLEEWNWAEDNDFTDFFYQHEANFRFSELLQVFYLTPIEDRSSTVQVVALNQPATNPFELGEIIQLMEINLQKKNISKLVETIQELGTIRNTTVTNILANLLDKKALRSLKNKQQYQVIEQVLTYLPDSIAFEKLLDFCKHGNLPLDYCQRKLAVVTNNYIKADSHAELYQKYQDLRTGLDGSIALIKAYGYEKTDLTKPLFFKEKVDYYGWIAATCPDSLFWIQRNVHLDMLTTKAPKALFYIAGLNFRHWKATRTEDAYLKNLLEQNIDVMLNYQPISSSEEAKQENLVQYWSVHYEDYAWDKIEQKFVNQHLFADELEAYDRYFRRLNSTNDTIAFEAFVALCAGKPNKIRQLLRKFKPLLRNYNRALPDLKYKIMEQVSQLVYYCRAHNIPYELDEKFTLELEKLSELVPPKERIKIENHLINTLNFEDLTALEYYGAIHAKNLTLNYSLGRILDYLYSKHWSEIVAHNEQFRLFLLKCTLYKGFGGFGVCKKYSDKVDVKDIATLDQLRYLQKLETNPLIRAQLATFLELNKGDIADQEILTFLENPTELDKEQLESLPPFQEKDVPLILQNLFLKNERKATRKIGDYLELHASIEIVPQLFAFPKENWVDNKNAGAALVKVLEAVYQFSFNALPQASVGQWWKIWYEMPELYANWSNYLFQRQLNYLSTATELTINDINSITKSRLYQPEHRELCLKGLSKVKKTRTVYRLQIEPKLSVKSEFKYIEKINFSVKELGDLSKVFNVDAPDILFNYIYEKAVSASVEEKSDLYNDLFRQAWFLAYITNGVIEPSKCQALKLVYYQYLSQSTFLTEYEEKATQLNLVHLENTYLTLKEKLEYLARDSMNELIRYDYLNAILSRIDFSEIAVVFPILKDLSIANKNLFLFFNRDFGLPIFDVSSEKEAQFLLKRLTELDEYEFYKQTLVDFDLPILKKSGALDFSKIYQLLSYDLVVPFLGEGGKYRDYYSYGLVKLLELHFNTTLGFHPKLNENQTFYTFNSYKRVEAWRTYLVSEGLVKKVNYQAFR